MKTLSIAALVAAISLGAAGLAQVAAQDTSASVSVDVSTSASVSASIDPSSVLSSASSNLSSALSSASSTLSSELSSMSMSASASGSASDTASITCETLEPSAINTTAIDAAMLAAVTNVQVFSVTECAGLADLAAIDAGASANLAGNANVAAALQAAGETTGDIVGYSLDGTSLVVYVRHKG